MLKHAFFIFLFFILLLFETTVFSFPFVLITAVIYFVFSQDVLSCIAIFLAAFFLDSLAIYHFGYSMAYIMANLLFLQFYKRYFEVKDPVFLVVFVSVTSILYSLLVGYEIHMLLYVVLCVSAFFGAYFLKKSHQLA